MSINKNICAHIFLSINAQRHEYTRIRMHKEVLGELGI